MSQPPGYNRGYSFTDFSSGSPTSQPPGLKIDAELNAIEATLDATLVNLALIQRDDGKLKNGSVGADQLDAGALVPIGIAAVGAAATFQSTAAAASAAAAAASAALLLPNGQTLSNQPTITPTFLNNFVVLTGQAQAVNIANPTGTAVPQWGIAIRIKDDGTARAITYGTQYRAVGVTLPTTTVISKTLYLGMIFNSTDTKWDVVAVLQEA